MTHDFTYIFERDAFPNGDVLFDAVVASGKKWIEWNDNLLDETNREILYNAIFHGSLENVKKISDLKTGFPVVESRLESFNVNEFSRFDEYDLNIDKFCTTIRKLLDGQKIRRVLDADGNFFCRPVSCLKPFSGRILNKNTLTPASFDYGFYHENMDLEIVCSSIKNIEIEYRFVVVNNKVVTGSQYQGVDRKAMERIDDKNNEAWIFAQRMIDEKVRDELDEEYKLLLYGVFIKDLCYVIDICKCNNKFLVVELNPFSGADLYNCDGKKILDTIENYIYENEFLKLEVRPSFDSGYNLGYELFDDSALVKDCLSECQIKLVGKSLSDFKDALSKLQLYNWSEPKEKCWGLDGTSWEFHYKEKGKMPKYIENWENFPENFDALISLFSETLNIKKLS